VEGLHSTTNYTTPHWCPPNWILVPCEQPIAVRHHKQLTNQKARTERERTEKRKEGATNTWARGQLRAPTASTAQASSLGAPSTGSTAAGLLNRRSRSLQLRTTNKAQHELKPHARTDAVPDPKIHTTRKNQNPMLSNFAQRFTTEMESYS
jgi:hypothetical protein